MTSAASRDGMLLVKVRSADCLQMARGIVAVGDMMATSISKTLVALAGALDNYALNAMNRSPPLSEPLTLSRSYVNR
jgi:hypothetical protein